MSSIKVKTPFKWHTVDVHNTMSHIEFTDSDFLTQEVSGDDGLCYVDNIKKSLFHVLKLDKDKLQNQFCTAPIITTFASIQSRSV